MIFLDTNILIEYLKGNKSFIEPYDFSELFISLNRKDFIYLNDIELV